MRWLARDGLKSYTYNLSEPRAPAIQGHISEELIYSLVCANTTRQLQKQPFPEWCVNTGTGRLKERNDRMSVKIKVSYNTDQELAGVIRLLSPVLKDYKVSRNKEGRYKKAYAELELRASSEKS